MYPMRFLASTLILAASLHAQHADAAGLARIEGTVHDVQGQPIAGAKVFAESGLEGALSTAQTDASGAFVFEELLPGTTGIFAYAPGHALDGRSTTLALDASERIDITLPKPGTLTGTVTDADGKPIAGARITRAAILGGSKVGVPFAKLSAYGVPEPTTNAQGEFSIPLLPQDAEVALKVGHAQYAQDDPIVRVGSRNARITLTPGILVSGTVVAQGRDVAVPNALLYFRNAEPPHGTVVTRSRADGGFVLRLTPGPWLYEASGTNYRSPNPQRVMISPDYPNQRVVLHVTGTASLQGVVMDAKSGAPVEGARMVLESNGLPAAMTRTGPTGTYELTGTQGQCVVRILSAPGYLLPPDTGMGTIVEAGQIVDIPKFWVTPLPKYSLEVIDAAEEPVAGAIVRVFRPEQFGWYVTDAEGLVELSFLTLPSDGTVVGMVEHPTRPDGAMFAITRDRSEDAIVQLAPLTSATGKVVNEKGAGTAGVLVEARTILEGFSDPVTLWRTYTAKDGQFRWPAVAPGTPIVCFASVLAAPGSPPASGASASIVPAKDAVADLGLITVPGAENGRSALGRKYAWQKHTVLCGALPAETANRPAVIVHVPPAQAEMMADALAHAQSVLAPSNAVFAVVVPGEASCATATIPILRGDPPAGPYTYVVNAAGEVVLESIGLPPVSTIAAIVSGG